MTIKRLRKSATEGFSADYGRCRVSAPPRAAGERRNRGVICEYINGMSLFCHAECDSASLVYSLSP